MYSFDVFNTLICRMTATPYGIFAIMRERLIAGLNGHSDIPQLSFRICNDFCTLRIQAENLARYHNHMRGVEEVTLNEIYEAMGMAEELTKEEQERLARLEQEIELDNVLPMKQNIERLKILVNQGEKVIIISDMYLPGKAIWQMLMKADDIFLHIPLYVSSELKARKTTGNIYRKIKEIEHIEYENWTHYGDDRFQDIHIASSLGIHAIYIEPEPFMVQEKRFLKLFPYNPTLQFFAGQARYTRYSNKISRTAEKIGSSICGPIIYSYISWMLKKCIQKKIKRLYFIARDGYLPKIVADKIIRERNLNIKTKYIYGSRKAWRVCSIRKECYNLFELIAWSYPKRIDTTEKLASVLELSVEELNPFLPYASKEKQTRLSIQGVYELALKLQRDNSFKEFYLNKQKEKRKLAVEYIRQQVNVTDDDFAFVEVAGGGFTQGCLKQLMADFYDKPIQTFFFKIDRVNQAKGCIYHVFFPSRIPNDLIVEMMFRAPHGQTIGYRQDGKKIEPIFDSFENIGLKEHGFDELRKAIELFVGQMIEVEKNNGDLLISMEIVEAYLRYVSSRPDKETLEYFATFPNNETGQRESIVEYAPRLTKEDILNIFLRKMYWEPLNKYYKGTNIDYSLLRCSKEDRELVKKCRQEYHSEWGIRERTLKNSVEQELVKKYGRAAYYPCELLEKEIILYGAGKFGKKLHDRIIAYGKSKIVKWVDKNASEKQIEISDEVMPVENIMDIDFDQIVIGVVDKILAGEIQEELQWLRIPKDKIFWIQTYWDKNPAIVWESAMIET